jgi:hypothetical protein
MSIFIGQSRTILKALNVFFGAYWLVTILLVAGMTSGCFDIRQPKKTIVENYYLQRSGEGFYYLQQRGHEVEGVGLLEGTVVQLGWSGTTILANRRACFRGDPDGWMVIDIASHRITGPISDRQVQEKYKTIKCYPAETAWKTL